MRIVNIGRFPPPIGGVSYFLQRLKSYLDNSQKNNTFYDISGIDTEKKEEKGIICCSQLRCFWEVLWQEKSLVVFHSNRLPILIGAQILGLKHKIVIFTHGESILKNKEKGFLYRFLLKSIDYFVTPTELIYKNLKKQYLKFEKKIFYIPFILFPKDIQPIKIKEVISIRNSSEYLLVGYAYDLIFHNGIDLYGVDMMIEVLYKLRNDGINVSLILLLPNCTNEEYYNELLKKSERYNLKQSVLILQERIDEAISLYKIADIYLRPTNTDGDSFSVWESLYVKTPVVASDVAQRPKECVMFKSRDMDDFYRETKKTIQNIEFHKSALETIQVKGNEDDLISFFNGCCKK